MAGRSKRKSTLSSAYVFAMYEMFPDTEVNTVAPHIGKKWKTTALFL
jgi:hypothetical protein